MEGSQSGHTKSSITEKNTKQSILDFSLIVKSLWQLLNSTLWHAGSPKQTQHVCIYSWLGSTSEERRVPPSSLCLWTLMARDASESSVVLFDLKLFFFSQPIKINFNFSVCAHY